MSDFFFLLLILFLFAVLLRMDWIYYLLYVVGGIWVFSHWWARRSLRNVTVARRLNQRAFTGESVVSEIVIRNHSLLPIPWLRLQDSVPLDLQTGESYRLVTSVGARSARRHRFQLFCHRRGYYEVGPLRLNTGDLFGFAQSAWEESQQLHVTVYPRVLTLNRLGLPSRLPFGELRSHQRLFMDPTRISGVRPYTSGDSMRHIHWRASAHEDVLLVKKYQPSIALSTVVVLDMDRASYPLRERFAGSEWAVVVAASVASHIAGQRQEVGLLTNGLDPFSEGDANPIPSQSGQAHLMSILDVLARIQLRRDETLADEEAEDAGLRSCYGLTRWLPAQAAALNWGATLIVVTARLSDPLLWTLHTFYRRGLNVLAITCVRQPGFAALQEQADALGITAYQTIWESDLAQIQ